MKTYTNPVYAYRRSPDQDGPPARARWSSSAPGPSGSPRRSTSRSTTSRCVVLDDDDTVSVGSRAICYAKRALEILDRLGCGERVVRKGVGWNVGKVFHRERARLPVRPAARARPSPPGVRQPAAVLPRGVPGRPRRRAAGRGDPLGEQASSACAPQRRPRRADASPRPTATTSCTCDWLIVADGARSPVRTHAGPRGRGAGVPRPLPDRRHPHAVRLPAGALVLVRPAVPSRTSRCCCTGRRTTSGASTSSSAGTPIPRRRRSPSGSCRGCARCSGADARVRHRVGERLHVPVPADAALPPRPRDLRRRRRAPGLAVRRARREQRHSRTPTTSSGSCGWCWKGSRRSGCSTATTSSGRAAADENILNSTRATDFITPKSAMSRIFRDAVLQLARRHAVRAPARQQRPAVGAARSTPSRRSTRRTGTARRSPARWCPARPAADAPVTGPGLARGCSTTCDQRLHAARVRRRGRAGGRGGAAARPHPLPRRRRSAASRRRPHRRAGRRRAWSPSATTAVRAPATCCAPTSTSARAGAASTPRRCARRSPAPPRATDRTREPP